MRDLIWVGVALVTFITGMVCVIGLAVLLARRMTDNRYQEGYEDGLAVGVEIPRELGGDVIQLPPRQSHSRRGHPKPHEPIWP